MELENKKELSLQDLRVIIRSLKMSGFSFVEPEALDQINFLIKNLPGPEQLNKIGSDPRETSRVKQQVGEIMKLIDIYGVKNFEYKTRYKAIKNLPPRYKVVDWDKTKKASINGLIRVSAVLEAKGKNKISERVMLLAEKIRSSDMGEEDIIKLANELSDGGFGIESFILKKTIKTALSNDVWQSGTGMEYISDVQAISNDLKNLKTYTEKLKSGSKTQTVVMKLDTLLEQLNQATLGWEDFLNSSQQIVSQADLASSQIEQTGNTSVQAFSIDDITKTAQTPAITKSDGQQVMGNQEIWGNVRLLAGGIQSILSEDAWQNGESKEYLKMVKSISDKMQNLKNMTLQLSSSNIPQIRDFMGGLVAEISDSADRWNQFVNQANGETPQLDKIDEQKDWLDNWLKSQGIIVQKKK